MEIYLTTEHVYHYIPQFSVDVARDRVEQKKVNLIAGTLGALFSRAKPSEVQLVTVENRVEPFWLVVASSRTVYDRVSTYNVTVGGAEVRSVTVLGQELPVMPQPKGNPAFLLSGVEHCVQELKAHQTFDGITGAKADLLKYANAPKTEIADINTFAPEGILVVPPQVSPGPGLDPPHRPLEPRVGGRIELAWLAPVGRYADGEYAPLAAGAGLGPRRAAPVEELDEGLLLVLDGDPAEALQPGLDGARLRDQPRHVPAQQPAVELGVVLVGPAAEEGLQQQAVLADVQPDQRLDLALSGEGDKERVRARTLEFELRLLDSGFDRRDGGRVLLRWHARGSL